MSEYIQVAESEQAATSVELETEDDGMHYFPHIVMVRFLRMVSRV